MDLFPSQQRTKNEEPRTKNISPVNSVVKTIALIRPIVEALLPVEPYLEPDAAGRVHADTARFVADQVEGMPTYLRWPYKTALNAFEWMSLRPYGRRFTRLDPVKQKLYLAMWISSALGPKRDFVKVIRSCALLAFYDHPVVLDRLARA